MTTLPFPRAHRRHREAPPRPSIKLRELRTRLAAVEHERDRLRQRNILLAEQLGITTVQLQAADERIALLQQQAERAAGAEKRAAAAEAELARLGAITVPPMVRDTTAPDEQATAPHGVRTVNGPVPLWDSPLADDTVPLPAA